jgi:hypothetical protein
MSDNETRRHGDYADMPRTWAWLLISVKEVGLPAVVIGALLYICFVSQRDMTTALQNVAVTLARLDSNDSQILNRLK